MAFRPLILGIMSSGGLTDGSWDVSTAVYDSVSFVTSEDTFMFAMRFKPDGTKMYLLGFNSDRIYQYTLSTAWDITTASYDSVSFLVSSPEANVTAFHLSTDGTKLYIVGFANDIIYQYTLSTAWNVGTASYDSVSFSVLSQDSAPYGLTFKPDGTKMYISGTSNDRIYQYTLSTAWDVSTASYDSKSFSVSAQETTPADVVFKPDGTRMYVPGSGSDDINQYNLSTPWDVSTASFDTAFVVINQATGAAAVAFNDEGSKMYVLDSATDDVFQYSVG